MQAAPPSRRTLHNIALQPTQAQTSVKSVQQRYSYLAKETDSILAAYPAPKPATSWTISSSSSALDRRKWMDRLGWVASV